MDLGTFSIGRAVRDIRASRAFYETLGFEVFDGQEEQNWLMLRNGSTKVGLFQGMFPTNTLTFNPTDARSIQKALKAKGIALTAEADEATTGPTYLALVDPDGNPILIDQH